MRLTNRETGEEALAKTNRWGECMQHQYDHVFTVFPEAQANQRPSEVLLGYI